MIDIDNNLYRQWTLKKWLVWTMDIEDVWSMDIEEYIEYLMIPVHVYPLLFLIPTSTLIQSSYLNSVPKFLFLSATANVQTLGQDTWPATTPATTTQLHGNE